MSRLPLTPGLTATAVLFFMVTSTLATDWPQWRGPNRDGVSREEGLLQQWPENGPKLRWKATAIGTGYSSPVIVGGRVYLQTTKGNDEFALALDEKTGDEIWSVRIGTVGKNRGPNYPGTRSTPTVDGSRMYCLASGGELVCLTLAGEEKWQRHLKDDFEGFVGNWAYTESVLVDGNAVICTPGGHRATLLSLNKSTGDVLWESAIPGGDVADYASIMVLQAGGAKQYVQFLRNGLVGVDAATGKFLWRYDRTMDRGANILTPIVAGDRVFSAGSRTGGGVVKVAAAGGKVLPKEQYFDKKLSPSIGGAVLLDGYLYGTAGDSLFCVDFKTGEFRWRHRSVGAASLCYADGRLYVRGYNSGDVALVEPTPSEYREQGRFAQAERSDKKSWPHPVVANGGLYLRDQNALLCYDVRRTAGK